MSKFVIECPTCGKYAEAKTGFFARRNIKCSCGNVINVRTDKMTSRKCSHCHNMVVFDQSNGDKAKCPVCHEDINTIAEQSKSMEFSCVQCGIRLSTTQGTTTYTCPVCDQVNNVQERVAKEQIRKEGLASIIKYEGNNETFVWKHPLEDFNYGSQLIVHESQEAIFFKDGQALDLFGAGRYALETQQLPLIEKLYGLPTNTESTFHSEVYYINMATQMGIKWGTDSKVRLFDPISGLHIEIGAGGEFNIKVINSRKLLLKLVGTTDALTQQQLLGSGADKGLFRSMVMTQVKSYLAQAIKDLSINILEIDAHLMKLSTELREKINVCLADYGLNMPEFFISRIVTPDDDANFKRMKEQFAAQYLLVREQEIREQEAIAASKRMAVEVETAARMKIIGAQGEAEALKIKKQAEAESYRMQAEAEAMEMKMKGYTYQQETAREIGLEAMQNGLISKNGSSGAGGLGDIAALGVTLGAMGGFIGMTKEAMAPVLEFGTTASAAALSSVAPVSSTGGWTCDCGQQVTGNFCSNCGSKQPNVNNSTWNCSCGQLGITGNFCSNCGNKKPQPMTWNCSCGKTDIAGNFCSDCGARRGDE